MEKRKRGTGRLYRQRNSAFIWCAYNLNGKEFRESTGETDEKKAEKYLDHKIKEVGAAQIGKSVFVSPKQQRRTVSELLDALKADYTLRGKATPQFESHLKVIRDYFGERKAVAVTAESIDAFIVARLKTEVPFRGGTYSPASVNRSTQLLSQAFNLAKRRGEFSAEIPYVRHLSESGNARKGFFGDVEFRKVESHLPDYLKDFARFGYVTGWRRGEICSLRWADVDGDAIRLRGENAKNGESRCVPIEGELSDLIERRREAREVKHDSGVSELSDLIFHNGTGGPIVDYRKSWATACRLAGCSGRLFHDLRRTAVRNMVHGGTPEIVAMKISGHKTRSMFDRYNIVNSGDMRAAIQRTRDYLVVAAAAEAKKHAVMGH